MNKCVGREIDWEGMRTGKGCGENHKVEGRGGLAEMRREIDPNNNSRGTCRDAVNEGQITYLLPIMHQLTLVLLGGMGMGMGWLGDKGAGGRELVFANKHEEAFSGVNKQKAKWLWPSLGSLV